MKLKHILIIIFFALIYSPIFAQNLELQVDAIMPVNYENTYIITQEEIQTFSAKEKILNSFNDLITKVEDVHNPLTTNFAQTLREEIKTLPEGERIPFLQELTAKAKQEGVLNRIDWYLLVEEGVAKSDFTMATCKRESEIIVNKLENALFEGDYTKLVNITRRIKTDIIKMLSQSDNSVALIENFTASYRNSAKLYGSMEKSLNLFLSQLTQDDLILDVVKRTPNINQETFYRNVFPAMTKTFSPEGFVAGNQKELLKGFLQRKSREESLGTFTDMLAKATEDKTLSQSQNKMLTKINTLKILAEISDPMYQKAKQQQTTPWVRGERAILREEALMKNFGELTTTNACNLYTMVSEVREKELNKVLLNPKGWLQSFYNWSVKSIKKVKPSGNTLLTIGAMASLIIAEEIITNYSDNTNQTAYLNAIDEIEDTIANGNMLKLVFNNIYDTDFARHFDNYVKEGNFDTNNQIAYMSLFDDFERALYQDFLEESTNNIPESILQCAILNVNCDGEKA